MILSYNFFMPFSEKSFKVSISHLKILLTVSKLNAAHAYPNKDGIGKILRGEIDDETLPFAKIATFGTLISFQGRKLASYVMMLQRHGYLLNKYDPVSNAFYLAITPAGEEEVRLFLKRHPQQFKKKSQTFKNTILIEK